LENNFKKENFKDDKIKLIGEEKEIRL